MKYYTRSYGNIENVERRDTDRMIVSFSNPPSYNANGKSIQQIETIIFSLVYTLNLIIAMAGIRYIPLFLKSNFSFFNTNNDFKKKIQLIHEVDEFGFELYLSTAIVCALANFGIFVVNLQELPNLTPVGFFFITMSCSEIIIVFCIVKYYDAIETKSTWCARRNGILALHTLAICNILWFLHNVGCNLLVIIFFLCLAPAQTIAAISLIYSVLICSVTCLTYTIHSIINCIPSFNPNTISTSIAATSSESESTSTDESTPLSESTPRPSKIERLVNFIKPFLFCIFCFLLLIFLMFLTFLFNELAENGLTSTLLGSIILSLVVPMLLFFITWKLQRYLEKTMKKDRTPLTSTPVGS